jgi:hypothetical protein
MKIYRLITVKYEEKLSETLEINKTEENRLGKKKETQESLPEYAKVVEVRTSKIIFLPV